MAPVYQRIYGTITVSVKLHSRQDLLAITLSRFSILYGFSGFVVKGLLGYGLLALVCGILWFPNLEQISAEEFRLEQHTKFVANVQQESVK